MIKKKKKKKRPFFNTIDHGQLIMGKKKILKSELKKWFKFFIFFIIF